MEVEYTDSFISPEGLRPDINFMPNNTTYIVDITVIYHDNADNLVKGLKRKLSKYVI